MDNLCKGRFIRKLLVTNNKTSKDIAHLRHNTNTDKVRKRWNKPLSTRITRSMQVRKHHLNALCSRKKIQKQKEAQFRQTIVGSKLPNNLLRNQKTTEDTLLLFYLKKLPEQITQNKKLDPIYNDYEGSTISQFNFLYNDCMIETPIKIESIPISKSRMVLEEFYNTHNISRSKFYRKTRAFLDKTTYMRRERAKNRLMISFHRPLSKQRSTEDFKQYKFQINIQPKKTIYKYSFNTYTN